MREGERERGRIRNKRGKEREREAKHLLEQNSCFNLIDKGCQLTMFYLKAEKHLFLFYLCHSRIEILEF